MTSFLCLAWPGLACATLVPIPLSHLPIPDPTLHSVACLHPASSLPPLSGPRPVPSPPPRQPHPPSAFISWPAETKEKTTDSGVLIAMRSRLVDREERAVISETESCNAARGGSSGSRGRSTEGWQGGQWSWHPGRPANLLRRVPQRTRGACCRGSEKGCGKLPPPQV